MNEVELYDILLAFCYFSLPRRLTANYETEGRWQRTDNLQRNLLHDGGEEGLRVEESSEPDGRRQLKVRYPRLEFAHPQQQVRVPGRQAVHGRVGALQPRVWNGVQVQSVTQYLHVSRDRQLSLCITATHLTDSTPKSVTQSINKS